MQMKLTSEELSSLRAVSEKSCEINTFDDDIFHKSIRFEYNTLILFFLFL